MAPWTVRAAVAGDYRAWSDLYRAYCAFYELESPQDQVDRVWSWVCDGRIDALVVAREDDPDALLGVAHVREFLRPAAGVVAGFLDDLYVVPAERGTGAADALFSAIAAHALSRGWERVRWITSESNYRARAAYDKRATRTPWVTYDMTDLEAPARAAR